MVVDGEDFDASLDWTNRDGPADLTGYTAQFIVGSDSGQQLLLTELDGITLGGTDGTIKLYAPASAISDSGIKSSRYRLLLTSPDGKVKCLLYGQFAIEGIS